MRSPIRLLSLLLVFLAPQVSFSATSAIYNIRDYGATGDGKTLDTIAINKAIDACSSAGGGQVFIAPGNYLTGTVHLKSSITLLLDAGAQLIGTPDLDQYQNLKLPDSTPFAANPRWHRALILGEGLENVTITGRGVINGNKVFDANGEEHMRGPHAILLGNCSNVTLRDFSIRDAANYAIMLEFTSHVEVRGVKITGGWDGVHFRGWKDKPCKDIAITDCEFYTGDDSIAGWYWEDTVIDRCILNSSCNGVRLIGPAKHLIIHDCLFFGPGRNEHRTSGARHRTNMLAGLNIQPSGWDKTEGAVDDVHINDIVMHDVATPLHLSAKAPSSIGHVTVDRLSATGCYREALSLESWSDQPTDHVTLRDVSVEFTGGGTAEQAATEVRPAGIDPRPLPAWGLYARKVKQLDLLNVRLSVEKEDARPAIIADGVESLTLDSLKLPKDGLGKMLLKKVTEVHADGPANAAKQ